MRTNESRDEGPLNAKYPKTLYWPWSPSISRGDGVHPDSSRFVGEPVVVTEKLDGGNTLLHAGKVHARSVAASSEGKWMAMVKKHHAWKVHESGVHLYGEDIYGVHSIEYEPVPEHETFYALIAGAGPFAVEAAHQQYVAVADTLDAAVGCVQAAFSRGPQRRVLHAGVTTGNRPPHKPQNRPFMKPAISRSPDWQLDAIGTSICPLAHPCSPARWRRLSKRR